MRQSLVPANDDALSMKSAVSNASTTIGRAAYLEIQKYIKLVQLMTEQNIDVRNINYLRIVLSKSE